MIEISTRIKQKHALEVDWNSSNVVPLEGEIIVYDSEYDKDGTVLSHPDNREPYNFTRFKIGDGFRLPKDLPFHNDGHTPIYYGVCESPSATSAKTVNIDNFSLVTGTTLIIKFTNANTASNPTLNVNNSGAKPMYRYGTTQIAASAATSGWNAGAVQMFTYDGNGWIRDYWNNTTYSNAGLGSGYATCSTAANTVAKTASLSSYALTTGGVVAVKFDNAVPANATLNINNRNAVSIYYRGGAITDGIIAAGDIATFIYDGSRYHLLSIDRWQNDITSIKSALNAKQATIIGGASTITSDDLAPSKVLISNDSGKVAVSTVTSTELGYLDGVSSNIQNQLNNKANVNALSGYYTKNEIDTMEFITTDEIDAICGTEIQVVDLNNSEVLF